MRTNEQTMSPEVREELRALFREELQLERVRKREQKTFRTQLWEEFSAELEAADKAAESVVDAGSFIGNPPRMQTARPMRYQVRSAIDALLRAVYRVQYSAWLPVDREPEMRAFIRSILDLMEKLRSKEVKP